MKRLERAGHVGHQRNPSHEREVRVRLTDQGRAIRAKPAPWALYGKAGMMEAEVADLTARVKALRDSFRAA